ncbi:MAG: thiL [Acidimicrobiales bacterium]|nr:thiL [Acidimicrobiales bacterium]
MTGEFAQIARLRPRFPLTGDDCAVVPAPGGAGWWLLGADAVVAGVHGDPAVIGLDGLAWRAVVANVSDVAAMGGRPRWLLATVSVPPGVDVDPVFDGIAAAAAEYGCELAGGDLTSTTGPLVLSVSIVGAVDAGPPPVLRSGAGPDDRLYVTGPLGGAAAASWRPRPTARVEEGESARLAGATAMIDVSDGLAADVGHLADESGVGIELDAVPVAEGATLEHALHGGEDFELVIAGPPGLPFIAIGRCVADPSVRTLAGAPLPAGGWEHRW